jgi:hypothetical protein
MRVYEFAGKSVKLTDLALPVSSLYLLAAPPPRRSAPPMTLGNMRELVSVISVG